MIKEIEKTREYLDYLEEHYNNVQKAWKEIQDKCFDLWFVRDEFYFNAMSNRIRIHDESKLSCDEFVQYRAHFFPTKKEQSDNNLNKSLFVKAWEHHQNHSTHHWGHFYHDPCDVYKGLLCIVEMICDWMAMGYKFGDNAHTYYESNKHEMTIREDDEEFMYMIFEKLYSPSLR